MRLPIGSSPRGRGKPVARALGDLCPRLIPARAGKTTQCKVHSIQCRAHPRAGGENARIAHQTQPCNGSSPRGRGKRRSLSRPGRVSRLIPARAGKTMSMVGNLSV